MADIENLVRWGEILNAIIEEAPNTADLVNELREEIDKAIKHESGHAYRRGYHLGGR